VLLSVPPLVGGAIYTGAVLAGWISASTLVLNSLKSREIIESGDQSPSV
jgi:hypothetical protein